MPNTNDQKIIERLTNDPALEMKRHELENLLESEVNKPAEEIDAQLVGELLDVLQPEEVPSSVQMEVWKSIDKQINPKPRQTHRLLQRLIAAAAIIVLLFGLSLGAAKAFHWTFLLKLLQPVAETFGIYMNYSDDQASEVVIENRYTISEDENTTVLHYDLAELPDTYNGHAIKPDWMPEGCAFVQASSFSEINLQKYAIDYVCEGQEISISISIHTDTEAVINYQYEQTRETTEDRVVGSRIVTFYNNAHDRQQLVSWIEDNAHYSICGTIPIEEIVHIVEQFPSRISE